MSLFRWGGKFPPGRYSQGYALEIRAPPPRIPRLSLLSSGSKILRPCTRWLTNGLPQLFDTRIGVVVLEDVCIAFAALCHANGACLAKTNAVPKA